MEFFSMCVENREHFQYPDHIFQDIEPTESSIRKEYLNEILHPGLNTILWNLAWFHAELCKEKLKQTEKSV